MRYLALVACVALCSVVLAAEAKKSWDKPPEMKIDVNKTYTATINTSKGKIVIDLFPKEAPKSVNNFVFLAREKFYDGTIFHRIIPNFMIQGGDPTGTGSGGESAWGKAFDDNINAQSPLYQGGYKRGIVAYANAGPNTNGSQFFIMHMDYELPPNYVIFARVTSGMTAVDAIADVQTVLGDDGAPSKPVMPQVIKTITVQP
jgi:cyclophilin family peptidyl-prolyl cis-trans isomerase